MDKFLEIYFLPSLNHSGVESLNRPITIKKTKSVIKKKLPTKKSPGPDAFNGQFYQTFKQLSSILFKLFPKTEEWKHSQTHFKRLVLPGYQSELRMLQEKITDKYPS